VTKLNIENIATFLAIVETKSLSKAAEKLYVSQSTISTRLNSLEKDLGIKLILRNPGKKMIELTPKGEDFVPIAKRWISLYKDTNMWISKSPNVKLNIGAIDTVNSYILSSLYNFILKEKSTLYIDISTHSSIQIFELLETFNIDYGITSRFIRNDNLIGEPMFSEKMVMISSPLYSNYDDVVHPKDLDVRNEIFQDWGPEFLIWHDKWWDPSERKKVIVDTSALVATCIDTKNAWSIVPLTVAQAIKKIKPVKISELLVPPDKRVYYKIKHRYPRTRSIKLLQLFEDLLDLYIKDHPYIEIIK